MESFISLTMGLQAAYNPSERNRGISPTSASILMTAVTNGEGPSGAYQLRCIQNGRKNIKSSWLFKSHIANTFSTRNLNPITRRRH